MFWFRRCDRSCGALESWPANYFLASTPTTLISDNMMGTLFAQGEIRKLCLFYDGLSERGPRGICGSLLAVRLACHHKVPIELLASEAPDGWRSGPRRVDFFGSEDLSGRGFRASHRERNSALGDI